MKSPENIAQKLTEKITNESFAVLKDKKFKQMVTLDLLDQAEQDRIFNELLANGLAVAVLMFRTVRDLSKNGKRSYFNELQMEMTSCYGNWLMELGTEKEFTGMWKELIQMRCEEYEKDFKKYKKDLPDIKEGNPWIPIVSFGCYHHIRKGKTDEADELFIYLTKWINSLAIMLSRAVAR